VTRNPASVERLLDGIGLGRQAHQHGDLVEGEAVPLHGTACIHGKETGARNLRLDLRRNEVRLGPLVGEYLAENLAPARSQRLQRTRGATRGSFYDRGGQTHDRRYRTVVAGQGKRESPRIIAGEANEIRGIGAAKAVDGLIRIANRA